MNDMKETIPPAPICSVDYAFQRIGGKYKGRIIWQLGAGTRRYGALRKSILGVTHKMLTQALRELEQDGLITRQAFAELPPRVEYTLTPTGQGLIPFITMLNEWAMQQMDAVGIPRYYKTSEHDLVCAPEAGRVTATADR
jgi:DNA-binding HxlR family transcriptional regulator